MDDKKIYSSMVIAEIVYEVQTKLIFDLNFDNDAQK